MPPLMIRKRTLIIWRLGQGVPQGEIAREVPCSQSTVSRIDQNWILDRQLEPKYHGSTRKTTEDEDKRIIEAGVFFYKFESITTIMTKIREELNLNIEIAERTLN